MAYVNVAEWKTDQVCEWLKGLDNSVLPYVHSFTNNCVNGQQLLNLRPEDLEQLGVLKLGHQEIILEAVEYLRNFHYELDRENLQLLALHLSCQAHSLHNELSRHTDSKPVTTQTLSDVASVVTAVKPLVRWLDRPPFSGQLEYNDKKSELLKLSLEMATCAQRDRFAEKPIEEIRTTCEQLAKLADYIIQDIADPMILQPASLDLATLKKRPGDDLGFYILPSFHGNHQIAEIKFGSAAHTCGKMEEGDEIVQVNYQTVVGWERKNVLELFSESPAEVLLTLKRRPRHTKVYGQIYIKPYRLPSNKKTPYATRWQHNLPSPRPELLTIPDFTMPLPRHVPKEPSPEPASIIDTVSMLDTMATDSSDSDSEVEPPLSVRLYATKPRNLVQRRATITGASPTTKHGIDIEQFWKELKQEHSTTFQLRDKAASCAHGLDSVPSNLRPQTCLGIEQTKRKKRLDERLDERKVQFHDKLSENYNSHADEFDKIVNETLNHTCRRDRDVASNGTTSNNNYSDNTVPLDKCDESNASSSVHDKDTMRANDIGARCRKERGKLDKSYSTPAYDLTETTLTDIIEIRETRSKINNCAACAPSITVNETDCRVSKETLENKDKESKEKRRDIETRDSETIGSVAQRVNYIESHIQHKDSEDKSCGLKITEEHGKENVVRSNGNDGRYKPSANEIQSNNDEIVTTEMTNSTSDKLEIETAAIPKISLEFSELGRESSEEKSESTSSYMEGTYSSSSEVDVPLRKLMENEALIAHGLAERNNDTSSINDSSKNRRLSDVKENTCSRAQTPDANVHSSAQNSKYERSDTLPRDCNPQARQCAELAKTELSKKLETKLRLTPPEPPPRKYFSKPLPLNLSGVSNSQDSREQPKVPERAECRAELKKIDPPEVPAISEAFGSAHHRDGFEGYRDFVEKSTDFIDEPITPLHEQKPPSFIDHYGYTEIYEGQLKDERSGNEKYESFHEKFGNGIHSIGDHGPPELAPRSIDSPDGSGCSRQAQTPELKPKTLEKDKHYDKGVVNRAMMVARSMGLHSGSNKSSSSSSPRSSRKRNLLLAKRRNVSVKDVGPGDLEGWLTYRSRGAGGAWARSWFVLKSSSLYRFKAQDSTKSDCLIALPGFTASAAAEVKSRKYAFKVYHTGTVFYFAADTEDSLALWLDSINKATLGADSQNRTSGLFSETDESDSESKNKSKGTPNQDSKQSHESMFGSLKKIGRKDSTGYKDHDIGGASLDRKYLRFLGARNQNVPVPTAQFRSYRRVLPTSTPNRKQDSTPNSPDLRVTVAGSTFYGLSASQSATDVPSTSQDMGDYRQTTDRSQSIRGRRSDDLRGFITLEEFMLAHQSAERRGTMSDRSASPRITPLTSDHVHIQHRNFDDSGSSHSHVRSVGEPALSNGMIYGHPRNGEESSLVSTNASYENSRHDATAERSANASFHQKQELEPVGTRADDRLSEKSFGMYRRTSYNNNKKSFVSGCAYNRKTQEGAVYYPSKQNDLSHWQNVTNEITHEQHRSSLQQSAISRPESAQGRFRRSDTSRGECLGPRIQSRNDHQCNNAVMQENYQSRDSSAVSDAMAGLQSVPRRFIRDNGYVGSSGDLTCCASSSETLQRARKEASVSRKGSFNLTDRRREHLSPDKHWMDSLRRNDKKNSVAEKSRLKNVAQYQPPPIPSSPFEQDGMRAAFEMHLDKGEQVHKTNRLKNLFGSKSPQKPNTLDLPKESPKTLLGSPRLHRALFREKSSSQQSRQTTIRSGSQSPGDSGISQSLSSYSGNSQSHTLSQSFSSVSSVSDWSPDTPTPNASKCLMGHAACQKRFPNSNRNSLTPPTLPYIPPPTSPPPDDYPGLEYPPVFEPGSYSLTDASLIRNRSKNIQSKGNREPEDAG